MKQSWEQESSHVSQECFYGVAFTGRRTTVRQPPTCRAPRWARDPEGDKTQSLPLKDSVWLGK